MSRLETLLSEFDHNNQYVHLKENHRINSLLADASEQGILF